MVELDRISDEFDNTKESIEFYEQYWKSIFEELGDEVSGDILYSFSTYGRALYRLTKKYRDEQSFPEIPKELKYKENPNLWYYELIMDSNEIPEQVKSSIKEYMKICYSPANMMLIRKGKDGDSLNVLKGSSFKDLPASFFNHIFHFIYSSSDERSRYSKIYSPLNQRYFNLFNNREDFIKKNYLEDVIKEGAFIEEVLLEANISYNRNQAIKMTPEECDVAMKIIKEYFDTAVHIIKLRAVRLEQQNI